MSLSPCNIRVMNRIELTFFVKNHEVGVLFLKKKKMVWKHRKEASNLKFKSSIKYLFFVLKKLKQLNYYTKMEKITVYWTQRNKIILKKRGDIKKEAFFENRSRKICWDIFMLFLELISFVFPLQPKMKERKIFLLLI